MALTSSSTIDDAKDQLLANGNYAQSGSLSEAAAYAEALRYLLLIPQSASSGSGAESYALASQHWAAMLEKVEAWQRVAASPRQVFGTSLVREA